MRLRRRYPVAVLLLLAAIALSAALASSAAALPTFTQAIGGIGPCDSCHTQTNTHAVSAHQPFINGGQCNQCHLTSTGTPPTPAACGSCHGGTATILGAHPSKGCATTVGCHGVVVAVPAITAITPLSGPVGTIVSLTGTGFPGVTSVTFNGVPAPTFTIETPISMKVTVPAGATSGFIAATTTAGTGTSTLSFTVTVSAKPKITKLSPTAGKRGATVTITGSAFGAKRGTSVVKFGSVKVAKYVSWSATKIKVKVPKAKFGKVKVSVKTAAGVSNTKSFTVKR